MPFLCVFFLCVLVLDWFFLHTSPTHSLGRGHIYFLSVADFPIFINGSSRHFLLWVYCRNSHPVHPAQREPSSRFYSHFIRLVGPGFWNGACNFRSHPHLSPPRPSGNSSFPPGFLLLSSWVLSVSFPCSFPQEERRKKTITSQEGLVSGPTKGLEKVWGRGASRAGCRLGNKVMALVL